MNEGESFLDRERALAALAGRLCPSYGLPCWICMALHVLTGTLRSVTGGYLHVHDEHGAGRALVSPELANYPLDNAGCVHSLGWGGDAYWNTDDASTTDPVLYQTVRRVQLAEATRRRA